MTISPKHADHVSELPENLSGVQTPTVLKNTASELAMSAMQVLGDGKFSSAVSSLTPQQARGILNGMPTAANDNRAPAVLAA